MEELERYLLLEVQNQKEKLLHLQSPMEDPLPRLTSFRSKRWIRDALFDILFFVVKRNVHGGMMRDLVVLAARSW